MTITSEPKKIQAGFEPIKGYVLEKLIGRGGYGEVWRAEAPGGLKKAVKFVFGQHDERRAAQELKSLERIKGIQHPFILTLERFEFIDNQLVIVTELADGSLEDVYTQNRERGSCGIPRDALLQYMSDAADALDHLHQLYKLQHLDIKPANLLIVGGRVKVADFGLLKDLGDVECSLVGGLTPIYAPPEVFDGRPSIQSDQYSLAVMYQELLTSARPFSGRTIAQLATQHVHNSPNLDPLPASDRPAVARALEKSPERRFECCTDFVEKLIHPHGRTQVVANKTSAEVDDDQTLAQHDVENLPEITGVDGEEHGARQTHALVVALGGTGADCLHELRNRIGELGAASPMTLHSVLVDTDPLSTQTACMIDATENVPRCRTIHAPLRSAKDYRDTGTSRFSSISRRWIYNVPRNLETGGMRPLGRLALVDHGDQLMEVLRESVLELKNAAAGSGNCRIYVVGSLAGGSGSGMFIDVAYVMRHLLDEMAMENHAILSLLTTNQFRGDPSRPLALHTMKSALNELAHFLKPGNGYPGDKGAGWPSVPAARTPLHDAYVVTCSDAPGAPTALESIADYLWTDANVCGRWFAEGRRSESGQSKTPCIRTFSVVQLTDAGERQSSLLAPNTVKSLLLRWLGTPKDTEEAAQDLQARIARRCYLEPESIRGQIEQWFGSNRNERRKRLTEHIKTLDSALLRNTKGLSGELLKWHSDQIDREQTEVVAEQAVQQIEREIKLRLQDGRLDLSSSIASLQLLAQSAESLAKTKQREGDEALERAERSQEPLERKKKPKSADLLAELHNACDFGELLLGAVADRVTAEIARQAADRLHELCEAYSDASARVAQGIQQLGQDGGWTQDPWQSLDEPIRKQLPKILDRFHQQTVVSWLYQLVRSPKSVSADSMVNELTVTAAGVIRDCIGTPLGVPNTESLTKRILALGDTTKLANPDADTKPEPIAEPADPSVDQTADLRGMIESLSMTQTHSWSAADVAAEPMTVDAAMEAVYPPLLECGGKQRLYLVCRNTAEQKRLESELQDACDLPVTTIIARAASPMLVHEAQQIELKNIVTWLDSLTGDDGKISARLASRSDIEWS